MRFAGGLLLSFLLLASCAGTRQMTSANCDRETSFSLGLKDAASGVAPSYTFLKSCSSDSRAAASAAYQEGFRSARSRSKAWKDSSGSEELESIGPKFPLDPVSGADPVRQPSNLSWVCEVEANSKIFTGVGTTRDEALGSARSTCGSYFRASYCEKADCKQSL